MDEQVTHSTPEQSGPIGCGDNTGCLPACAPLANPYVPFQREDSKTYQAPRALIRGTLFPGLDLPFMGLVNHQEKDTPLGELMALGFAMHELGLYLDTHQHDQQALELFNQYSSLYREGAQQYAAQYGPLNQSQAGKDGTYQWLNDPWPWEFVRDGGEA